MEMHYDQMHSSHRINIVKLHNFLKKNMTLRINLWRYEERASSSI